MRAGWLLLVLLPLQVSRPDTFSPLGSCHQKFAFIEAGGLSRRPVTFTSAELNAYLAQEARDFGRNSIREPHMELTTDHARTTARIDFVALAAARGRSLNWLMERMFSGERSVTVVTKFVGEKGQGKVDLEQIEVDGHVLEGRPLDFLIEQFVAADFPEAQIGRWFPLHFGIRTIRVLPERVVVSGSS